MNELLMIGIILSIIVLCCIGPYIVVVNGREEDRILGYRKD
jgi:hypothetical protein